MLIDLIKDSVILLLLKKFWRRYSFIQQWLDTTYKYSQTHRFIEGLWQRIKLCFRYSFLGRITRPHNTTVLDNSKVLFWVANYYRKRKEGLVGYSRTSVMTESIRKVENEFFFLPIQFASIIVVIAIVVNIFLSLILRKEIALSGWLMRIVLLSIGLGGISCAVTWPDLRKASFILRKLDEKNKNSTYNRSA